MPQRPRSSFDVLAFGRYCLHFELKRLPHEGHFFTLKEPISVRLANKLYLIRQYCPQSTHQWGEMLCRYVIFHSCIYFICIAYRYQKNGSPHGIYNEQPEKKRGSLEQSDDGSSGSDSEVARIHYEQEMVITIFVAHKTLICACLTTVSYKWISGTTCCSSAV